MTGNEIAKALVLAFYCVVAIGSITMAVIVMVKAPQRPPREHLCSVAEISPDMTKKEREHCRLIRGHKL